MTHEDHEKQIAVLTYLNGTGPGDYEINSTIGAKNATSTKRNDPAYTIGAKPKRLPAYGEYSKHFLMRDSPAAGKYNPNHEMLKTDSPKFTVSKSKRFEEP